MIVLRRGGRVGRRRSTRNRVGCNKSRGFESHPLRHNIAFKGLRLRAQSLFNKKINKYSIANFVNCNSGKRLEKQRKR